MEPFAKAIERDYVHENSVKASDGIIGGIWPKARRDESRTMRAVAFVVSRAEP